MKNLIKTGRAAVYITADGLDYAIVAVEDVTVEELYDAVAAEEELDKYRRRAVWNQ